MTRKPRKAPECSGKGTVSDALRRLARLLARAAARDIASPAADSTPSSDDAGGGDQKERDKGGRST
jgi:hypothetical protein